MFVKQILIYFPLLLILFLVQSFFWVPTYDEQGRGNPKRLVKYLDGSSGDASLLNPVLSADSASSVIEGKVYDGLIDLDENLRLRPRLATSWVEYEEATLAFDVSLAGSLGPGVDTPRDFARAILQALRPQRDWYSNIKKVDILPAKKVSTKILLPAEVGAEGEKVPRVEVPYRLNMPAQVKFTLKKVDQDFFKPIEKLLGKRYFDAFPYKKYIRANDLHEQKLLASHYQEILPITVHHPVVVFTLREGVRFHDGHEFDSGDVLFTYRSLMNPKNASPRTSDYEPVESVEPLGPGKIRITYKRLFSPAINSWAMGILPEHLLNESRLKEEAAKRGLDWENFSLRDSEFNRHPIGTGAFVFKEWKSDELIRLTRNPDYWEGPPEYEEFVMRIIPDTLTREMEFYAGAVDNYSVEPHQVSRLGADPKYHSISSVGSFYTYIGYNTRKPLLQSAKVRRALGMAVDVDKIIQYVLYGEGERVTGPYGKITDWYDHTVPAVPYDPEGALKIFSELGWEKNADGYLEKDGKVFEFNLITNSGNEIRKNILTIVQDSWRKIGVKCNTQVFEWAVFLKDFVNSLKFDALILGWSMGADPDLYQLWHSSQAGLNQLNFVGYKNPEADRLIVRIRREYDRDRQIEMAHQLHKLVARDQPYTFLYVRKATRLLDRKIVIVDKNPDGSEKFVKITPVPSGDIGFNFNRWRKLQTAPEFAVDG